MELNLLVMEDEKDVREQIVKYFSKEKIGDISFNVSSATDFPEGIEQIRTKDFDLIILDLCKGAPKKDAHKPGYGALKAIQDTAFTPVVFYSGLAGELMDLSSNIIGVVNKGEGLTKLRDELKRIIDSKLGLIKKQIYDHIRTSLKDYFWDTVQKEKDYFKDIANDISFGYLILRRISNSLSKENIKEILKDDKISPDNAHPMEFYIYPTNKDKELELGEILKLEEAYYIILTPSCDMVKRKNGSRKSNTVFLVRAIKLEDIDDYKDLKTLFRKKNKTETDTKQIRRLEVTLKNWLRNNEGNKDRYFFLPSTTFIPHLIVDFQEKTNVPYVTAKKFTRIAKLDDPFAQAMLATFIRYYNRVGFPDLDIEFVFSQLALNIQQE